MNYDSMRCPIQAEEAELLLNYIARKLPADKTVALERHIEHCAECRRFAEGQQLVWKALDDWNAIPAPEDFDARLYARIDEMDRAPVWKRWLMGGETAFSWKPAVSLAAASLALTVGIFVYAPGGASQKSAEAVEIEQVERTLEDLEMLKQLSGQAGSQEL